MSHTSVRFPFGMVTRPEITRTVRAGPGSISTLAAALLVLTALLHPVPGAAQQGASGGEWRVFSADAGSTRYSSLDQIDASNVSDLQVAWSRLAVDPSIVRLRPEVLDRRMIGTPIVADGVLYVPNVVGLVEAIDPGTGETLWIQEPFEGGSGEEGSGEDGRGDEQDDRGEAYVRGTSTRGAAYWQDAENEEDRRVLSIRRGFLYALDAATGAAVTEFGEEGRLDLTTGLQEGSSYMWYGAPVVLGDVVIVGQTMSDTFRSKEGLRGDVRAFDVRTGELRWVFHTIPQAGEPGNDTWEDDAWEFTGHAPVWAQFSVDPELGYVYMPVSSSTNDMYGGHRPGDNLFSQSLVCVDGETGELVWHYQLVHHGLWDYDPPAAPILMDIVVDGRPIRAVAQITKQAFAYVFDRETGEPVWPIVERPVPESDVPGEWTSPTQPFPTRPPAFDLQGSLDENLIDFTPELRAEALEIVSRYTTGPLFTPPTVREEGPDGNLGTIQLPGSQGGADIQGAAFDPETNVLYVPSITAPFVADLLPGDPEETNLRYTKGDRMWIGGPRGLPLFKPPYGRITAMDMDRGEILWQVPNGDGPRDHPAIRHLDLGPLGTPGRASPLATATLLFLGEGSDGITSESRVPPGMPLNIAANYGEPVFRAYDKQTGEVVWETELPTGVTTAAPITYMHEDRQYIVVPVDGADVPPQLIAFSLP